MPFSNGVWSRRRQRDLLLENVDPDHIASEGECLLFLLPHMRRDDIWRCVSFVVHFWRPWPPFFFPPALPLRICRSSTCRWIPRVRQVCRRQSIGMPVCNPCPPISKAGNESRWRWIWLPARVFPPTIRVCCATAWPSTMLPRAGAGSRWPGPKPRITTAGSFFHCSRCARSARRTCRRRRLASHSRPGSSGATITFWPLTTSTRSIRG